jgi:predicted HNH restriction endonuclease
MTWTPVQNSTRQTKRKRLMQELIDAKGNKCKKCEQTFSQECFDFHHRNPMTKMFAMRQSTMTDYPWDAVMAEADKCDLLCSNCHRSIHVSQDEEYFDEDTNRRHRDRRTVLNSNDQMSLFSDSELDVSDGHNSIR